MNATEKRIIRQLVAHLAAAGFHWDGIHEPDGEKFEALEEYLADYEFAGFIGPDRQGHWVRLIVGNDEDIVSDYGVTHAGDGWNEAMDAFFEKLAQEDLDAAEARQGHSPDDTWRGN